MGRDRLQQARELFEAAAAAGMPAREAILEQGCGADAELRAVVEGMIEADGEAHEILDRPFNLTDAEGANVAETFAPGGAIGPYRIVRELGAGGMGTVYLAERADGPAPERYAIKILSWWSHGQMRRFREEQSILSRLHHPNIARLIESGTAQSKCPYFVMEYVDGRPIHSFCNEHGYSTQERIQLFRQLCGAIRYLHQNLVMHRDLKPSNVLVTTGGAVKLLDFGIAKPLPGYDGADSLTQTMAGLMTPDYASPEQIRGERVSTLTDVYALGVLLYELLTGVRPFENSSKQLHDRLRSICEEEPERPSNAVSERHSGERKKVVQRLRGELDNIILKAMQKEPARRYGSVEQLDEDLRRYLQGLPVLTQNDSVFYRARKFVRRHRVGAAAVATIFVLLAGGVFATTTEAGLARRERARAEEQARSAEQSEATAEIEAQEAKQEKLRAEQEAIEAKREKTNAERRLSQIQQVAKSAARAYTAGAMADLPPDIAALIAEVTRDSLSPLGQERLLEPKLAGLLDAATLDLHGYELAKEDSWQVPAGWSADASQPGQYRVGIDHRLLYQGKPTLFVRSMVPHPAGEVTISQSFSARKYRGKRVRLSAWLRTDRADLSPAPQVLLNIDQLSEPARPSGTGPWKRYEVVEDVPELTEDLGFAVRFMGTGTLWAGHFAFEAVEASVPLTNRPSVLPNAPENLDFTKSRK
jgi:serine/threonine protein kinase